MKRAFPILVFALCVLARNPAHALTSLADEDLSEVSAQTGVSIFVDITLNIHIDCIAWGDPDGIGGAPQPLTRSAHAAGPGARQGEHALSVSVLTRAVSPLVAEALRRWEADGRVCLFPGVDGLSCTVSDKAPIVPFPPR